MRHPAWPARSVPGHVDGARAGALPGAMTHRPSPTPGVHCIRSQCPYATLGADLTNQMGVGHNTYVPDFSSGGRSRGRAPTGGSATDQDNPAINGAGPDRGGDPPDAVSRPPTAWPPTATPPPGAGGPSRPGGAGVTGGAGGGSAAAAGGEAAAVAVPVVPV